MQVDPNTTYNVLYVIETRTTNEQGREVWTRRVGKAETLAQFENAENWSVDDLHWRAINGSGGCYIIADESRDFPNKTVLLRVRIFDDALYRKCLAQ